MSLEDRFRQTLADAISDVKIRLETEFAAAVADVKADADRERAAALAESRQALQSELQSVFEAEKAALVSSHESLLAQAADAARLEATRLADSAAADAAATVEAIRTELRDAQSAAMAQREASEQALARLREEHDAALATLQAEHDASAARMREEFDAAASHARQLADTALASLRAEAQEAATLHSHAVDAHETGALRLLESVRTLDGSTSLSEVLDALAIGASREAGRAAMLVVKGDRMIGWRTIGFGPLDQEPRAIESSTADVDALAAAVNTGRPAVVGSGSVLTAPTFSDAPADRPGLAVPLLVAGRPVAVLYADPGTAAGSTGWTSPVEVLVRHAARCLEGLAVQRATAGKAAGARVGAPA